MLPCRHISHCLLLATSLLVTNIQADENNSADTALQADPQTTTTTLVSISEEELSKLTETKATLAKLKELNKTNEAVKLNASTLVEISAEELAELKTAEKELEAMIKAEEEKLIGSWQVDIAGKYPTGQPALFSFLPGGVIIQSDTPLVDPIMGNRAFSNGQGSWELVKTNNGFSIHIQYRKNSYAADSFYEGLYLLVKGNLQIESHIDNKQKTHLILTGNITVQNKPEKPERLEGNTALQRAITMSFSGEKITVDTPPE